MIPATAKHFAITIYRRVLLIDLCLANTSFNLYHGSGEECTEFARSCLAVSG